MEGGGEPEGADMVQREIKGMAKVAVIAAAFLFDSLSFCLEAIIYNLFILSGFRYCFGIHVPLKVKRNRR